MGTIVLGTLQFVNQASPQIMAVANSLDTLGAAARSLGMQLIVLGGTLYRSLTVPLMGLVKIGIDFEHHFANVVKTVQGFGYVDAFGKLNIQAKAFQDQLREMATRLPFTHKQLTEIAAFGGQFGVHKRDLADFTETVAKLGTTIDGIEVETAAKALAQIKNITGDASKGYGKLAATLVDLGNKGISTEGTILEITRRMSGAGAVAKMSSSQMFGWSAAVANLGHRSELGGNAIANTILKVSRSVAEGGDKLAALARISGKSAKQFAEDWGKDASAALNQLLTRISTMSKTKIPSAISELFGTSVRQNQVLLTLVNTMDDLNKTLGDSETAYKKGTAMEDEFAKKAITLQNQLAVLQNRVRDVAITIAQPFMDALRGVIIWLDPFFKHIESLAKSFSELDKSAQRIIVTFAVLGGVGIPTLIIAVGGLLWVFGSLVGILAQVGIAIATIGGSAATASLLGWLTASSAAIGAFVVSASTLVGVVLLVIGTLYALTKARDAAFDSWVAPQIIQMAQDFGVLSKEVKTFASAEEEAAYKSEQLGLAYYGLRQKVIDFGVEQGIIGDKTQDMITNWDSLYSKFGSVSKILDILRRQFIDFSKDVAPPDWLMMILTGGAGAWTLNAIMNANTRRNYVPPAGANIAPKGFRLPAEDEKELGALIPFPETIGRLPRMGFGGMAYSDVFSKVNKDLALTNLLMSKNQVIQSDLNAMLLEETPYERMAKDAKAASEAARKEAEALKKLMENFEFYQDMHKMIGLEDYMKFNRMTIALQDLTSKGIKPGAAFFREYGDTAVKAADYITATGGTISKEMKGIIAGSEENIKKLNEIFLEMADPKKFSTKLQEFGLSIYEFKQELDDLQFEQWVERQTNATVQAIAKWEHGLKDLKEKVDIKPSNVSIELWERYVATLNQIEVGKLARIVRESDELRKVYVLFSKLPGGGFGIKAIEDFLNLMGGGKAKGGEDDPTKKIQTGIEKVHKLVKDTAQAFSKLKSIMGDTWNQDSLIAYIAELANVANVAGEIGEQFEVSLKLFKDAISEAGENKGKDPASAIAAAIGMVMAAVQAYALLQTATDKASKAQRVLGGAMAGAMLGASIGGRAGIYGAIAGFVVGAFVGAFRKVPWAEIGQRVGHDFGVAISDSLAKTIKADADKIFGGDWQSAAIYHLKEIIDAAGGINNINFDQLLRNLRDAFVMLDQGRMTAGQVQKILDDTFDQFLAEGTDALGFVSTKLLEIVDLSLRFGIESKKIKEFFKAQGDSLIDAINVMGKMMPKQDAWMALGDTIDSARKAIEELNKTPLGERDADWTKDMAKETEKLNKALAEQQVEAAGAATQMENLGLTIAGTFFAAIAAGRTFNQAMRDAKDGLDSFFGAMKALGLSSSDPLLKLLEIQWKVQQAIPNTIAGVDALGQSIVGLFNMKLLTPDIFSSIQKTAYDAYVAIQGQVAAVGGTTRDALIPMQAYLQQAAKAAKDLNIPLDETTQMMIDQSIELGIWKELGPSAMEALTSALNTLITRLDVLITQLIDMPEAPNPFRNWTVPPVPDPENPNAPMPPGGNRKGPPEEFAGGTIGSGSWFGNFGAGTNAILHGSEAVITPGQAVPFAASILGQDMFAGSSASSGGPIPVTLLVKNHRVLTEVVLEDADSFLASRGVRR